MFYSRDAQTKLTEDFETCRYRAYKDKCKQQLKDAYHCCTENCPGIWTLGFGHIKNVKEGDTCTFAQAEKWLQDDLAVAIACVNCFVCVPLTQHMFDALVDFVFNVGAHHFTESTCLKLLNQKKYHEAADEFAKWKYSGGEILAGLIRRRKAEHDYFETKDSSNDADSNPGESRSACTGN